MAGELTLPGYFTFPAPYFEFVVFPKIAFTC